MIAPAIRLCCALLALSLPGTTSAQSVLVPLEQSIAAADRTAGDGFSKAIAISGDTMVIAAQGDDTATGSNAGSVRVFTRSGTTWTQQAVLTPNDAAAGDRFGTAVAIAGNTVAVGATHDDTPGGILNAGSVTIFTRSGTTWTQQAKHTAGNAAQDDHFGKSVALAGDTLLIGADNKNNGSGVAYVFLRNAGTWSQQAELIAATLQPNDSFGCSVALSGDTALIGTEGDDQAATDMNEGCAYVFLRNGSTWTQQAQLIASDTQTDHAFGTAVALTGDSALIGATGSDGYRGAAYVFERNGTNWLQSSKLSADQGLPYDTFGGAIALMEDLAVAGSPLAADAGMAALFRRTDTTWTFQNLISMPDGATGDEAGGAIALDGDSLALGAPGDDAASGKAQVFRLLLDPTFTQAWRFSHFGLTGNSGAAADLADPDHDGLVNLLERAFLMNPAQPDQTIVTPGSGTSGLPHVSLAGIDPTRLRIEFLRRKANSQLDMTWRAQFGSTLNDTDWIEVTNTTSIISVDAEWERVVIEDTPPPDSPRRFARVKVTSP